MSLGIMMMACQAGPSMNVQPRVVVIQGGHGMKSAKQTMCTWSPVAPAITG